MELNDRVTLGPGYLVRQVGNVLVARPATVGDLDWHLIDEDTPKGTYLLLRGPSGYTGTQHRYIVARHAAEFRPRQPWVDYAGDSVLDGGDMPTEWCAL